jgi:uncharacterized DUF497 family protein
LRIEWDDEKNRINLAKHGLSFETAMGQAIGWVENVAIVLVAHLWTRELIRIVSARMATPREPRLYEETIN